MAKKYFLLMCGQIGCLPDYRYFLDDINSVKSEAQNWAIYDEQAAQDWQGLTEALEQADEICFYGGHNQVVEIIAMSEQAAINDGYITKDGEFIDIE